MPTSRIIHSYTDWHDVDEDNRIILCHGGKWFEGDAGIALRWLANAPTSLLDVVASSNIQKYKIIRMLMMSTKI